jgi:DNA-binding PadR family transcriptional regulator
MPCGCGGGFNRHFIYPAVLLLLSREPAHGYSLFRKMAELGLMDEGSGPTPVYRVLTRLEDEGLAVHEHVAEGQGPARKVFSLTGEGREALTSWWVRLEHMKRLIGWFEEGYAERAK